jgi:flagellum-specific peptidoglycan hydrolase FlgJ
MLSKSLTLVKSGLQAAWFKIRPKRNQIILNLLLISCLTLLLTQRELSFQFKMGIPAWLGGTGSESIKTQTASIIPTNMKWWDDVKQDQSKIEKELNLANPATAVGAALTDAQKKEAAKYSNLGFVLNPALGKKLKVSDEVVAFKRQKCLNYVAEYAKIAREEMEIFGIPASITLAQGLVESNAGDSQLSRKENNHFGIKCRSKCLGCRCANYTDDDKYDMFRIFDSAWYSFREHSKLLMGDRYKHLLKLDPSDYKGWARGLQKAGYATNKKYAETLIAIIEKMDLHKYDR